MIKKIRKLLPVLNAIIIVLSIAICIMYARIYFLESDYLMLTASGIVIFLILFMNLLEIVIKKEIPIILKTAYYMFVFISAVLGAVVNLYEHVFLYDKLMHFISGIYISWLFVVGYNYFIKTNRYKENIFILFLTSFNAAIALFWEIGEYIMDYVLDTNFQKGLNDTMGDTIVAVMGGLLVTTIYLYVKKKTISA